MSKEQTPIEWLLTKLNLNNDAWIEIEKWESQAKQKEKEHTQAKVLEALERVVQMANETDMSNSEFELFEKRIEIEVKPKYKLK